MKELLLFLVRSTNDHADWFAPLQAALDGVTEEQALSKPAWADHSIAALTAHLHFYQQRDLNRFLGKRDPEQTPANDLTFTPPPPGQWVTLVENTFHVLRGWEEAIRSASEDQCRQFAQPVAEITTHLAYHTGQIILLRKWQGSWDPDKGVR